MLIDDLIKYCDGQYQNGMCRYTYKYFSEMIYGLKQIELSEYPFFHILSLGCGGVPDLMAFQYMNYNKKISYVGLDKLQ